MLDTLTGPKGITYWVIMLLALALAAFVYFAKSPHASAVNAALAKGAADLKTPEVTFPYDAAFLEKFRTAAGSLRLDGGDTVLERYVSSVLIWKDVLFAISLGVFACMFNLWLASHAGGHTWLAALAICAAGMGALYGIIDVAEDLMLANLLTSKATIAPSQGYLACALTGVKLASLVLSGTGLVVFLVLRRLAAVA